MRRTWVSVFLSIVFSNVALGVERDYYLTPSIKIGWWLTENQSEEGVDSLNLANVRFSLSSGVSFRNFWFEGDHRFFYKKEIETGEFEEYSEYDYSFRLGDQRNWPAVFKLDMYEKPVYNTGLSSSLLDKVSINGGDTEIESSKKISLISEKEIGSFERVFKASKHFVDGSIDSAPTYSFLKDEIGFSLFDFSRDDFYYRFNSSYQEETNSRRDQGYSYNDSSLFFYFPVFQRVFFTPAVVFSSYKQKGLDGAGGEHFYLAPGVTFFGSNRVDYITLIKGKDTKTREYYSSYYGSLKRDSFSFDISWTDRAKGSRKTADLVYSFRDFGFSVFANKSTNLRSFRNVFEAFKGFAVCNIELSVYDPNFCQIYGDDLFLSPDNYLVPYFEVTSSILEDVFHDDIFGGALFGDLSKFSFNFTLFNRLSKSSNSSLIEDVDYFKFFLKWSISDSYHVLFDSELRRGQVNNTKIPGLDALSIKFRREVNSFSSWELSLQKSHATNLSGRELNENRVGFTYQISY